MSETAPKGAGAKDALKTAIGSARAGVQTPKADAEASWNFQELYEEESKQLGDPIAANSVWIRGDDHEDGEPWVAFTAKDRFGIALSGGGIRSATFNLGLLQALQSLGILEYVDYLSTVSGGGYIGGFWSAWRSRRKSAKDDPDPRISPFARVQPGVEPGVVTDVDPGAREPAVEQPEVRHLREFSRFLLPRVGVLETEFWGIVMTVLGGMVPSVLTAVSVLALGWCVWLAGIASLTIGGYSAGVLAGVLVLLYLAITEYFWRRAHRSEPNQDDMVAFAIGTTVASLITTLLWILIDPTLENSALNWTGALTSPALSFRPAAVLGAVTLTLLIIRILWTRTFGKERQIATLVGFERAVTRIVALATGITAAAVLWSVAMLVPATFEKWQLPTIGVATGLSAAMFAWLKDWLLKPVVETRASSLTRALTGWLQRATPKILAWIALIGLFVLVGVALDASARHFGNLLVAWWAVSGVLILLLTAALFDPARVGLHEFYRSRIARCYLGASNPDVGDGGAEANRHVGERANDDRRLKDIVGQYGGPIHLVCVAANELSGDKLASLYRGARSAVLSGNGISLGNKTSKLDELRVSSALTASAAAFNSQMGRVSIDLGPAVTFLMSALNLRLGLWVPHPDNKIRRQYRLPGRFFLRELLGRSRTNGRHLHLSDGNHFENFGLYELIRRHCRYIIVSDCGADPDDAFDDLANVLRRVREDFGVEVEIDVSPLRPSATGDVRQHAVVGAIHYDGANGMDKGSLIFFKPGLTGDEPADVLQYRTRCPQFPHQTTQDQFYDEPQWESHRRLGEHAGRTIFGFLDRPFSAEAHFVDHVFFKARNLWQPGPDGQHESFLAMSERCADLEEAILSDGPRSLSNEFFREVIELAAFASTDEEIQTLSCLMRVLQLMEDAWIAGEFQRYWSHPLNEGWMAYFHRWASTAQLRRWWPILAPIYGPDFREFAADQLGLKTCHTAESDGDDEAPVTSAELVLSTPIDPEIFKSSALWRQHLQTNPDSTLGGKVIYRYDLRLISPNGILDARSLAVGFALVRENESLNYRYATWNASELYIPPWLHGSGIMGRLLESVIRHYRKVDATTQSKPFTAIWAKFKVEASEVPARGAPRPQALGPAARFLMVRTIEFYKSRGFQYERPAREATGEISLMLKLNDVEAATKPSVNA